VSNNTLFGQTRLKKTVIFFAGGRLVFGVIDFQLFSVAL